jgi:hypothetical protein
MTLSRKELAMETVRACLPEHNLVSISKTFYGRNLAMLRNIRYWSLPEWSTFPGSIISISIMTLSLMKLSIMTLNTDWCYAERNLCWVPLVLSVSSKPVMLSVVRLSVVMLSVVMLSVIMLSVVMLSVVMLSVVILNVVASGSDTASVTWLKSFKTLTRSPTTSPCPSPTPSSLATEPLESSTRAKCYQTFYNCNLQMFVIS